MIRFVSTTTQDLGQKGGAKEQELVLLIIFVCCFL